MDNARRLADGSEVLAEARFFTIEVSDHEIDVAGWSENERRVIDQNALRPFNR